AYRPFSYIRPVSRKHDAGFSVTGPVYIPKLYDGRNKTFFSFNYEHFRNRNRAAASFQTLPNDAYRNGDFSAALTGRDLAAAVGGDWMGRAVPENGIYDLQTSRTVDGRTFRDLFPGNVIPRSR